MQLPERVVRRRTVVWVALAFAAGIYVASEVPRPSTISALGFGLMLALAAILARRHVPGAAWLVLVAVAGALRWWSVGEPADVRWLTEFPGRVEISGCVDAEPDVRPNGTRVVVTVDSIQWRDRWLPVVCRMLVRFKRNPDVAYHDMLQVRGRITEPGTARNPGEFDYRAYLANQGIRVLFEPVAWHPITARAPAADWSWTGSLIAPLRRLLKSHLYAHLSGEPAALVWGLLFGEKQEMSERSVTAFQRTGTLHQLAVSGSNVGVVIAVIWGLLSLLRLPARIRIAGAMLAVVLFCQLAHNEASVVRASVAAGIVLVGRWSGRSSDSLCIWGGSLLVLLVVVPSDLFHVGFQLSYLATLGIILVMPLLSGRRFHARWARGLWWVAAAWSVSLAAQLATWPVLAAAFHQVPVITPVSNLVCVPLASVVTAAGVVGLLAAPLGEPAGAVCSGATWLATVALQRSVFFFDGLDWPMLRSAAPGLLESGGYLGLGLCALVFASVPRVRRRLLLGLCVAAAAGAACLSVGRTGVTEILVLDTGQRPASLIHWPSGRTWAIVAPGATRRPGVRRRMADVTRHLGWALPESTFEPGRTGLESPGAHLPATVAPARREKPARAEIELHVYPDSDTVAAVRYNEGGASILWLADPGALADPVLSIDDRCVVILYTTRESQLEAAAVDPAVLILSPGGKPTVAQEHTVSGVLEVSTRRSGAVRLQCADSAVKVSPTIR